MPPARGTQQAWVRASLWNKRTSRIGQVITVLLDSGAEGGTSASVPFIRGIEQTEYEGRDMVSKRGRGRLRAANPSDSGVPPMNILGTCVLFLVFPPAGGSFGTKIRVVERLPFGLILGTAFMRRHHSALLFDGPGSGWFRPGAESPRVPLLPWLIPPSRRRQTARDGEEPPRSSEV